MVFSSPVFLYLFLPLVTLSYFLFPRWGKNGLLLLASLIFYAWGEPVYVLLMIASAVVNYAVGLWIESRPPGTRGRRLVLTLGLGFNLGALGYFKYWGFLASNLHDLLQWSGQPPEVPLPLGISFFTFQAISYLMDVYREEARAQRNVLNVALYIALFPQLIAGPIVRYGLMREALIRRRSTLAGATSGVELFIRGLAKKVLLANPLGQLADVAFSLPPDRLPMSLAWLGALAYSLQIYFDFSGYTDMARGVGRVFGFEFPENFRLPYLARSLRDFWRRWHITLSTWFRDYVYVPLGGNRRSRSRTYLNLWIVFALCGLWHGASWTFLLWGLLHGAWLVWERSRFGRWLERAPWLVGWGLTAVFLLFSWTLFRADSIDLAAGYAAAMVDPGTFAQPMPVEAIAVMDGRFWGTLVVAVALALGGGQAALRQGRRIHLALGKGDWWPLLLGRYVVVCGALAVSLLQLATDQFNPFIYFRF